MEFAFDECPMPRFCVNCQTREGKTEAEEATKSPRDTFKMKVDGKIVGKVEAISDEKIPVQSTADVKIFKLKPINLGTNMSLACCAASSWIFE